MENGRRTRLSSQNVSEPYSSRKSERLVSARVDSYQGSPSGEPQNEVFSAARSGADANNYNISANCSFDFGWRSASALR
jgi:hypothetical protein